MTRTESHLCWGIALVVAAFILGYKESNPLPWAIAAAGIIVLLFAAVIMARDNAKGES